MKVLKKHLISSNESTEERIRSQSLLLYEDLLEYRLLTLFVEGGLGALWSLCLMMSIE